MHHIFHTEGIILGSRNYGEAGKCYYIFTRDHGMLYASAQGVRKISSKLRFVLQDFSYIKLDLVKGRDFWRITSCTKIGELEEIKNKKEHLIIFANIARLLKRLLAGEEENKDLFVDLLKGLKILEKTKIQDLPNIEMVLVLRILYNLGYIGGKTHTDKFTVFPFEEDLVLEVAKYKSNILKEINQALKETHL